MRLSATNAASETRCFNDSEGYCVIQIQNGRALIAAVLFGGLCWASYVFANSAPGAGLVQDATTVVDHVAVGGAAGPKSPRMDSLIYVFIAGTVAAAGGIGGGGILVPLYILVEHMTPHAAIPMSKITILGNALCQLMLNFPKRHPERPHRRLIDYDAALIMEPSTLGGTIIGVMLNKVLPGWIITALLIVFLVFTTRRTFNKGFKMWAKESERKNVESPTKKFGVDSGSLQGKNGGSCPFVEEESRSPLPKCRQLFMVWVAVFAFSMAKGGHGAPSILGLECGSGKYWVMVLSIFPFLWYVTNGKAQQLQQATQDKQRAKYNFAEGDVVWDAKASTRYPAFCMGAGIMAGMLGVGGGMVMQPIMMEMDMRPEVASATAAFMMLFTSSCTSFQFAILGMLDWELGKYFMLVGFCSAIVGQLAVGWALKKYNRQSIIVFAVATIIGVSTILMGYTSIQSTMAVYTTGENAGFNSVCS